jgi:hypothetical protein
VHAGRRDRHVHHLRTEAVAGNLEGQQRPRRILEEAVDLGEAGQQVRLPPRLAIERDPALGFVETS